LALHQVSREKNCLHLEISTMQFSFRVVTNSRCDKDGYDLFNDPRISW